LVQRELEFLVVWVIVHIATHGLVDEAHDRAALALTPPAGRDRSEGLFQGKDIPDKIGNCRLVFLSTCRSGVGKECPLEMRNSLARAFLSRRASRVVSTLWDIGDKEAPALVDAFYASVAASIAAGKQPDYAKALRDAKIAVLRRAPRAHESCRTNHTLPSSGTTSSRQKRSAERNPKSSDSREDDSSLCAGENQ